MPHCNIDMLESKDEVSCC